MPTIRLKRVSGEFGFETYDEENHTVKMDSKAELGGQNYGVRPMNLLLMGLAGCSAIDVITILHKQRQSVREYETIVHGEREKGKEPSLWSDITIEFVLFGEIDAEKAEKAVALSLQKYCSVAATLEKAGAKITSKITIQP